MRVTDRTVQQRIGEARELVESYPATLDAWESGRLTRAHVRVIMDAGAPVPADRRAEFEAEAIRLCAGDTPNRVRSAVEILAERCAERSFTERHAEASRGRRVRVVPGAQGMSDLIATVPTVIAEGSWTASRSRRRSSSMRAPRRRRPAHDRSGACRRAQRPAPDGRAGARSDRLRRRAGNARCDPRPGAGHRARPHPPRRRRGPVDLVGRAPIDADTARCLAAETHSLARVLTDPVDGTVIAVDRYRTADRSGDSCAPATSTAAFPDAAARPSAARSTTPSTTPGADPPPWGTSPTCASDIIR
jgi:hypothetical protein